MHQPQPQPQLFQKYQKLGALSAVFHDSSSKTFRIEGPHGKGLQLKSNSEGKYVIFAGGTGILPFLDFFDYLLRKIVIKLIATKFGK